MAKAKPRTGELTTANYGWTKPTVGASNDAWGGYINADLDGVDSVVYSIQTSVPAASITPPAMDGTAAFGAGTTYARADHVHPSDTSRYAASNPAGYQTAAQVTAVLANYLPLVGGTLTGALIGTAATFSGNAQGALIITKQSGSGDAWISYRNSAGTQMGYSGWNHTDSNIYHANQSSQLVLSGTTFNSQFTFQTCPGGGPWSASSDARIKTVEGDYTDGLEAIQGLRPVVYRYLGNDTTHGDFARGAAPYEASPHYNVAKEGKAFVGLIAQEVEAVMPGMVRQRAGFIDGDAVSDFRELDTGELIFALVNAVKTLAARVEALEGAR